MALFGRTTIDDPDLRQLTGRRRVLASGRSPVGQVLGLADALMFAGPDGTRELPWHEIATGGWTRETNTLRWTTVDGEQGELELVETGLLPDLFNERVTASIAVVRTVSLAGAGSAVITARRNLGDDAAALVWSATPGRGTTPEQVAADPVVGDELARLRAEYDVG
ncbi:MAG: hypothetical protein QM779_03045 [Propionicimonas sp.]|uniref:hypothetical protein n=1 Tax=Propionicimonas sp. TaxID=1955623 RepID=UPI003D123C8E